MASSLTINGRSTSIPDVYGYITSGIVNPPSPLDFGNVLIIDDGSLLTGISGASGVNGTNKQGVNSIYGFTNITQYQNLIKDGLLFQVGVGLFKPSKQSNIPGANQVFYIKAATTAPATSTVTLSKGTIAFTTNEEGTVINGVLSPQTYNANTIAVPVIPTLTPSGSGGTLAAGTYFYKITALNANGQTIASPEASTTTSGSTSSVGLAWTAVTGATSYRIYRGTIAGGENVYYTSGTNSFTDINGVSTNGVPPTTNTAIIGTTISNELAQGYGVRIEKGKAFGYALVFYKGTVPANQDTFNPNTYWSGAIVPSNNVIPGVNSQITNAQLLFRSPDSTNIRSLQTWLNKSASVKNLFKTVTVTFTGNNNFDDALVSVDATQYTAIVPYSLFAGGTETFGASDFTAALTAIKNLSHTFFLPLGYGNNAQSTNNLLILNLLTSGDLKYDKYMLVGGGIDNSEFNQDSNASVQIAQAYNSQHVVVVHAGGKIADNRQGTGFRIVSQFYKTANILGRLAGLTPQTPVTFKDIAIDSDLDTLTNDNKEIAIQAGVTYTNFDNELNAFIVGYGLTTLQDNQFLVNSAGNSYDIAVERIKSQLNKAIIINAKTTFFGTNKGPNRNTVSTESLTSWLGGFLSAQVATASIDNLILGWQNITVTLTQDIYYVSFQFIANSPIKAIVFNGVMING